MKLLTNKLIFGLLQNFCRWKKWNIKNFPSHDDWNVKSFKCNLLGFILGSQKCPNCNKIDTLYSYENYDSLTIFCSECKTEYYSITNVLHFGDFGIHSAAIINLPDIGIIKSRNI